MPTPHVVIVKDENNKNVRSSGYSAQAEAQTRSPNPAGAMKDSRRKPENDRSGTAPSYARDVSPGPAVAPSVQPPSTAGSLPEAPRSTAGMSAPTRAPKAADVQSRAPSRPQGVSQTQRALPAQPRPRGAGSLSPQRASSPSPSDPLTQSAKARPEPSTASPRLQPGGSGPAGLHGGMTKSHGEKGEVAPARALPGGAGPAGMPMVHRQDGTASAQTRPASSKSRPRSPELGVDIESTHARPGGAGSPPSRAAPAPSKSEAVARTTPGPEAATATTLDHPHGVRSSSSPKYDSAMRSTSGSASKSEAPRDGKALTRSEDFAVVSTREHPRADRPRSPGDRAGAGPIPSPDIMAKASRARSPLSVAPAKPKGQRARSPKAKMDPTAASVPSTLGIAASRGGPTGRMPVAQSHHGTAEEWVESAHFPTKHTQPAAVPPKPFV
ncbi:unnamed protein product, partial [Symbiodinium microadriaticum]